MPSDPERYLSVGDLEDELPFSPSAFDVDNTETNADGNTDWDNLLQRLLDEESDRIEQMASTLFVQTETSATLYGDEDTVGDDLPLPDRPVVDVASIGVDGDPLEVGTDVRVRETHVELLDDAAIYSWPDGPIEVTWTYGYDAVPGDVRDGLVRLVRSRLERIQSDGLESEGLPTGQSASYRPPEEIVAAVADDVGGYSPPSYFGGTMVI
ncbi:DUF1302 domain-containing protein [Natrinema pallidum]|uniref:DUF1302 domain-containing protein n=1 Tax=Natrinema pallidum TaxID=69527 RepID=A0A4P9TFH4_9EURY|nr:DUF1302 domain-containing protein [Natrinema pallidum]QCW03566.1 DUF1302 domain-containing protein [Natrinema pallidum]